MPGSDGKEPVNRLCVSVRCLRYERFPVFTVTGLVSWLCLKVREDNRASFPKSSDMAAVRGTVSLEAISVTEDGSVTTLPADRITVTAMFADAQPERAVNCALPLLTAVTRLWFFTVAVHIEPLIQVTTA